MAEHRELTWLTKGREYHRRLKALGFATYDDYLESEHWRDLKRRYKASDLPQRCACGRPRFAFHHNSYARLGAEHLTDIEPICNACHRQVHLRERALKRRFQKPSYFSPSQRSDLPPPRARPSRKRRIPTAERRRRAQAKALAEVRAESSS